MSTARSNRSYHLQGAARLGNTLLNSLSFVGEIKSVHVLGVYLVDDIRRRWHIVYRDMVCPFLRFQFYRYDTDQIVQVTRVSGVCPFIQGFKCRIVFAYTERVDCVAPLAYFFLWCSNASTRSIAICVGQVGEIYSTSAIIVARGVSSVSDVTFYSITSRCL